MFTKTYIVRCKIIRVTELQSFTYALVNAGNRRGALTKFLFHVNEINGFPNINPHESFLAHRSDNEKVKVYYNNTHEIRIEIEQINPHGDVIFVGGSYDLQE